MDFSQCIGLVKMKNLSIKINIGSHKKYLVKTKNILMWCPVNHSNGALFCGDESRSFVYCGLVENFCDKLIEVLRTCGSVKNFLWQVDRQFCGLIDL